MAIHNAIEYPVQQIREWIQAGWTQTRIAETLQDSLDPRVSPKLIYKVCKLHGIKCQRTGPRSAEGHPEWKGGRIVNRSGYIEIYCPRHPNARKHTKYILEHRLVMERHLGRNLLKSEVVHHKNGDKKDNRIENLEVFASNSQHLSETLKGCVPNWTKEGKSRMGATGKKLTIQPEKREGFVLRGRTRNAIQSALGLGGFPSRQQIRHYLDGLGITFAEACEMVATLGSLPPFPRPMKEHGSLP